MRKLSAVVVICLVGVPAVLGNVKAPDPISL